MYVKISDWSDGSKKEFWGECNIHVGEYLADASDQIKIRLTMFYRSLDGGTRHAIAPVVNDDSQYFETTISDVEKTLYCTIAMKYIVARGSDYLRVYFGGENETCLYNWGFKPR